MTARPAAVLFDCDGVLADSEALVNGIVAEDLTARGWPITAEQCQGIFLGRAIPDMVPVIERQVGPLPAEWPMELAGVIAARMRQATPPMPGALAVVQAMAAAGIPLACASNSGRDELEAKLAGLGLAPFFGERVFSYQDVPRPKPAPDMYLAAAAACGADPRDCVVVEDSALGTRAGIAAGCRVMGFAHETPAALLEAEGATPFARMEDLPRLLGIAA
ncbi:HAD family hydrolase [Pseudoroseomonas ludipueritiae]|uniref:HAD family phosphatase n=1 Tax=Pseudoroseomonas ludipueritiae TaxID=198093 RepID=A0ABR7R9J6_9PROT|nr:HAD family phosphatase [Pseudoroseomonas ludipueritiae]MBC9178494.1 HAD family phosphatase [Pseudoroseomonas ludipueritiae]